MITKEELTTPWWKILEDTYGTWDKIPLNHEQRIIVEKIINDDINGINTT